MQNMNMKYDKIVIYVRQMAGWMKTIHPKDLNSTGELADHLCSRYCETLIISTFQECFQDGEFQQNHPSITPKIIFQSPEDPLCNTHWDGFACFTPLEIQ